VDPILAWLGIKPEHVPHSIVPPVAAPRDVTDLRTFRDVVNQLPQRTIGPVSSLPKIPLWHQQPHVDQKLAAALLDQTPGLTNTVSNLVPASAFAKVAAHVGQTAGERGGAPAAKEAAIAGAAFMLPEEARRLVVNRVSQLASLGRAIARGSEVSAADMLKAHGGTLAEWEDIGERVSREQRATLNQYRREIKQLVPNKEDLLHLLEQEEYGNFREPMGGKSQPGERYPELGGIFAQVHNETRDEINRLYAAHSVESMHPKTVPDAAVRPSLLDRIGSFLDGDAGVPHANKFMRVRPDSVATQLALHALPQQGDNFGILTAENPGGLPASAEANAMHNASLDAALKAQRLTSVPVQGAYTDNTTGELLTEKSRLIPGATPQDVVQLGSRFGQNGVISGSGYHDLASGQLFPASGVHPTAEPPYTQMPDGRRFALDINWDAPRPMGEPQLKQPAEWRRPVEHTLRQRNAAAETVLKAIEANPPVPFKPESRGVFDRSGFDPDYRMLDGQNTMPPATGNPNFDLYERMQSPKLQSLLKRQANLGMGLGGAGFYNLAPVAASFEGMPGLINNFKTVMGATTAGSIQASLPNELHNASQLLYAKAHGLNSEQVRAVFNRELGDVAGSSWLNQGHFKKWEEFLRTGSINPTGPASGARKLPAYLRAKLGESSPDATPVIDTHESKAVFLPMGFDDKVPTIGNADITGQEYEQVGDLYRHLAKQMGVRPEQFQASRWFGGGTLTGLKSPRGDYTQQVEDALLYTAQKTGRDTSPAGLKQLWEDVTQGRAFLLPFYGRGPLPIK
jgi:hypothetical protein